MTINSVKIYASTQQSPFVVESVIVWFLCASGFAMPFATIERMMQRIPSTQKTTPTIMYNASFGLKNKKPRKKYVSPFPQFLRRKPKNLKKFGMQISTRRRSKQKIKTQIGIIYEVKSYAQSASLTIDMTMPKIAAMIDAICVPKSKLQVAIF